MAERSFPLENTLYTAEEASLWFATRTSGVHASDSLGVSAGSGMTIMVGTGVAWLKYADYAGVAYANTESKALTVPTANGSYPRIDRVVLRYSKSENRVYLAIRSGTPESTPKVPNIVRDSSTYEISLAQVYVAANATNISASNITDERLNNAVCGLMSDGVTPFNMDFAEGPPENLSTGEYRVANETELETVLNNVLSGMPDNTAKYIVITPSNTEMGFGSAMLTEVYRRTAEYVTVRMVGYAPNNPNVVYKTKWAGVWQPLAWLNPALDLGVEYRTLERYNNKPVYAKLFDFGTLPNATNAYVAFNPSRTIDTVVDVKPIYYSSVFNQYFAGTIGEVDQCYANSNGSVAIKTNTDASGMTAKILIKYTLK